MFLLGVFFWFMVSIIAVFILLTIIPIRYDICGVWRDTKLCRIQVQYGPLSGIYSYDSKQLHDFRLSFFGLRFGKKDRQKDKIKKSLKTKDKKGEAGLAIKDIRHIIEKEFLTALFKTINAIYRHSRPAIWNINGVLGFDDPYYTGLFAALRQLLPRIDIEPDFSREICNLSMHIRGRIVVLVLIYYVLSFLVSREARPVLFGLWKSRKTHKGSSGKTAFCS